MAAKFGSNSYLWEANDLAASLINPKATLIQRFSLFSGVSLSDCENIVSRAREKVFSRRQTVFTEGDSVRQILLLVSGCVKLTQVGQDGSEVILRLSGPGEIVGSLGLYSDSEYCSTAQTMEASVALAWDRETFEGACERCPALRRNMVRALEGRLQEMDQRFRELSTEKVAARLSSQLVRLLNQVGKRVNGDDPEINLSRSELAQLTGTTLFTVSRLLCQWQQQGIVYSRRESVLVRDLPALEDLFSGRGGGGVTSLGAGA
jgi:CRP-like cAMP-binding protein